MSCCWGLSLGFGVVIVSNICDGDPFWWCCFPSWFSCVVLFVAHLPLRVLPPLMGGVSSFVDWSLGGLGNEPGLLTLVSFLGCFFFSGRPCVLLLGSFRLIVVFLPHAMVSIVWVMLLSFTLGSLVWCCVSPLPPLGRSCFPLPLRAVLLWAVLVWCCFHLVCGTPFSSLILGVAALSSSFFWVLHAFTLSLVGFALLHLLGVSPCLFSCSVFLSLFFFWVRDSVNPCSEVRD